jgi:hypothetical protein
VSGSVGGRHLHPPSHVTQAYYIGLGHPVNSTCVQHPPSKILTFTERYTHCYKTVSDIENPPELGYPRADFLYDKRIANTEIHYVRGICNRIYIVHQSDMRYRNHHIPRDYTLPIHGIHQSLLRLCHSERTRRCT